MMGDRGFEMGERDNGRLGHGDGERHVMRDTGFEIGERDNGRWRHKRRHGTAIWSDGGKRHWQI